MAALTPEQIKKLRQIIADASTAAAVVTSGYEIPDEDLKRLIDEGFIDPEQIENFVLDGFTFGQLMSKIPQAKDWLYSRFQKFLGANPVALTSAEQRAYDFASARAGTYIVGLGNRYSQELGTVLIDADQALADRLRVGVRSAVAEKKARRQTVGELKTNLGRLSEDWARDWDRVAATESHNAHQEGVLSATVARHGGGAMMAKIPEPDACKHCRRLYLGSDGLPIVKPASWWQAQGTNAGLKPADWKPVLGAMHPWCRCQLVRVPAGFGFNDDLELLPESDLDKSDSLPEGSKLTKGDKLPGGKADKRKPGDFDQASLKEGTEHELEHTNDRKIAQEIAMDHLAEDPDYYVKLRRIEKARKLHGRKRFAGFNISIENRKGSVRRWYDPGTKTHGETKMLWPYGYIRMTEGMDGDHVDVFLGPDEAAPNVYVVHQLKAPHFERYDEDKVMLGWRSAKAAKQAYLTHYDRPEFFGGMTTMPLEVFRKKVYSRKRQMIKAAERRKANGQIGLPFEDPLQSVEVWQKAVQSAGVPLGSFGLVVAKARAGDADARAQLETVYDELEKANAFEVYPRKDLATLNTMGNYDGKAARTAGANVRPGPQTANPVDWPPGRDPKKRRRKPRKVISDYPGAERVGDTPDHLVDPKRRFDVKGAGFEPGNRTSGDMELVEQYQEPERRADAANNKEALMAQTEGRIELRGPLPLNEPAKSGRSDK